MLPSVLDVIKGSVFMGSHCSAKGQRVTVLHSLQFYLIFLCLLQLIIFTSQYPSHASFCTWADFAHILYAFSFQSQMNTVINIFQTTRKWYLLFSIFHTISIKPNCAAQRRYLSESSHLHDVRAERLSSSRRPAAGSSLKMMRTSVASLHWVTASMIVVAMDILLGA